MNESTSNLKFECIHCGKCCTDKKTLVNVTYNDVLRIKEGLGLEEDELTQTLGFYIFEKEPTEEDRKKMVVSPIETEKGLAFMGLMKNSDGRCFFYDSKKKRCLIYKLRPNFCRTFPFSFEVQNLQKTKNDMNLKIKITEKGKQYCPGLNSEAPEINIKEVKKLGRNTIEDLNKNYYFLKEWNDAVNQGKLEPSVKTFLSKICRIEKIE